MILVTGASGLIGRSIMKELKGQKKEFIGISSSRVQEYRKSRVVRLDLAQSTNFKLLIDIISSQKVDCIIHCAAIVPKNKYELSECARINLIIDENIIRLAEEFHIPLIYSSSTSVYGNDTSHVFSEECETNPKNFYSNAKLESELSIKERIEKGTVLRISSPYGGSSRSTNILNLLIDSTIKGKEVLLYNEQRSQYYIHADDIAKACLNSRMREGRNYEILNVVSDKATTTYELAQIFKKHMKNPSAAHFNYALNNLENEYQPIIPNNKAKNLLKWRPIISLEDGITELLRNSV
jgi:nucleoside-diphosphate-sugar epimerase